MSASNVVRWTPSRIEKAILCPKPKGAIAKAMHHHYGTAWRGKDQKALRALSYIVEHADLLDIPTQSDVSRDPDRWLLIRTPAWLLETLALLDTALEDLEPDFDHEDGADREPEVDDEDDGVTEPNVTRPDTMGRWELSDGEQTFAASAAQRQRYRLGAGWHELHKAQRWVNAKRRL